MNKNEIRDAVKRILIEIGEDPSREGLKETPRRIADMYEELIRIEEQPPDLKTFKNPGWDEIIVRKNITGFSLCEHHLLPFRFKAHVAYLPSDRIVGVSKIARVVGYFSKRLQLQERLTHQIAEYLHKGLNARGTAVIIEGEHLCEQMRGAKSEGEFITSAFYGAFRDEERVKNEVLGLLGFGGGHKR